MPAAAEAAPAEVVTQLTGAGAEIMKRAAAAKTESFVDRMAGHFDAQFPEAKGGRPPGHSVNEPPQEAPATEAGPPQTDAPALPTKAEIKPAKADKPLIPEKLLTPDAKTDAIAPDKEIADFTKGMSQKATDNFKKVYERATVAEKQLAELRGELEKTKAAPKVDTAEIEALKKQNQELDQIVKQTALERHPKFKNYYDGGKEELIASAKAIVGEKLAKDVESLLRNPNAPSETFEKLAEEVGQFKASQIAAVAANITRLDIERGKQLDNWKSGYAEMEKHQGELAQEQQSRQLRLYESSAEKAIRDANGEIVFKEAEGESDWNAEVKSRQDEIRRIVKEDLDPDDKAQLAMQAVAGVKYRQLFHHQVPLIKKLQSEISELKGAQPNAGGNGGGGSTILDGNDDNLSMIDRVVKSAANNGLLAG